MSILSRCLVPFVLFAGFLQAAYPPQFKNARAEVYRTVDETELKVWIIGDKEAGQRKPAVVLFFGGSWRFGSPSDLESHANYLASRGFICLLPDYRVFARNGSKVVSCVEDARAAFDWTLENAERLGIHRSRIAVGGASAGGHLAACLAFSPASVAKAIPDALLLWNPVLVMAPFEGKSFGFTRRLNERFLGIAAESISPIHHVAPKAPPVWMTHGSVDQLVPVATAKAFQSEMTDQGNRCELLVMEGERHAFHYLDPNFSKVMTSAFAFLESLDWLN